jgi:hypothetical protein
MKDKIEKTLNQYSELNKYNLKFIPESNFDLLKKDIENLFLEQFYCEYHGCGLSERCKEQCEICSYL